MSILNERTESTKKVIHIMVTSLCERNCKYCCNKSYDLNDIPYVTDEELREAEIICITGGEPFQFTSPCDIAAYYKEKYPNIKSVYVYTNALELALYLRNGGKIHHIDGLNVSIKCAMDVDYFEEIKNKKKIKQLPSNILYVFNNLYHNDVHGFKVVNREWQSDFEPANDSIFRKA